MNTLEDDYRRLQDAGLAFLTSEPHPSFQAVDGFTMLLDHPACQMVIDLARYRMNAVLVGSAQPLVGPDAGALEALMFAVNVLLVERHAAGVLVRERETDLTAEE